MPRSVHGRMMMLAGVLSGEEQIAARRSHAIVVACPASDLGKGVRPVRVGVYVPARDLEINRIRDDVLSKDIAQRHQRLQNDLLVGDAVGTIESTGRIAAQNKPEHRLSVVVGGAIEKILDLVGIVMDDADVIVLLPKIGFEHHHDLVQQSHPDPINRFPMSLVEIGLECDLPFLQDAQRDRADAAIGADGCWIGSILVGNVGGTDRDGRWGVHNFLLFVAVIFLLFGLGASSLRWDSCITTGIIPNLLNRTIQLNSIHTNDIGNLLQHAIVATGYNFIWSAQIDVQIIQGGRQFIQSTTFIAFRSMTQIFQNLLEFCGGRRLVLIFIFG
mmetsp:Transcript_29089/g.81846  ORF Transcript_29089/g.81846 Transcript_29089/m.81846 type:complete len:330 (+) Transcript_29089:132-1121(+)